MNPQGRRGRKDTDESIQVSRVQKVHFFVWLVPFVDGVSIDNIPVNVGEHSSEVTRNLTIRGFSLYETCLGLESPPESFLTNVLK